MTVGAALLAGAGACFAQAIDTTLWVTNGTVSCVARDAGHIYIGGQFTRMGPATGAAVAVDSATGSPKQPFPKISGTVRVVVPDGSGGWYVGGSFAAVRGQARGNLAQMDATGKLTAWSPNADGTVNALVVSGGCVYAGGTFSYIGGQSRNAITALDTAGAATSWDPNANSDVYTLAMTGDTVYAGGDLCSGRCCRTARGPMSRQRCGCRGCVLRALHCAGAELRESRRDRSVAVETGSPLASRGALWAVARPRRPTAAPWHAHPSNHGRIFNS